MFATRALPLLFPLGLVACSGASTPEIPGPSTTESSANEPAGSGSTPSLAGSSDAGSNAPPPTGDEEKDPPPAPECPTEVEPNEKADKATAFTSCISGALANNRDNDFFRVVAPATGTMLIAHQETSGKVLYRVSQENGLPIGISFTEDAPEIPVEGGGSYLFRLTFPNKNEGGGNGARPYKLTVTFK
jgi:hypothetical protein